MSVAARFYVSAFELTAYGPPGSGRVTLTAVSRGDQNRQWASATPSGKVEMTINNPPAAEWFRDRIGRDIDLHFTEAAVHQAGDGHPWRESLAEAGTAYGPPYCGDCGRPESEHAPAAARG